MSESASQELIALRDKYEAEILRLESDYLREAWGEHVPRDQYLYDDPSFGYFGRVGSSRAVAYTSLDDRRDGSLRPIYETEQDLAAIRGAARNLALQTGIRTGILDALANYTLGGGFTFEAAPENETDRQSLALSRVVRDVINRFVDENDFSGVVDREIHQRSREDGECLVAFDEDEIRAGRVLVEFLEPDQIVEPRNPEQLNDWLGCGFPSCWKFGVHTPEGKTWKSLGYHVVRDGRGADWDYYDANRVEHIKRNVPRNAKRGYSDFFEVIQDLLGESKLAANMAHGAALQSAIAWILQGAAGQTQSQLSSVGGADRATFSRPSVFGTSGQSSTANAAHYPRGTILKVGNGQQYLPGPLGAERNAGFEVVAQYALRRIGVRWNMPEYMVSGDASNANYASALVAESPFVKAREADQQFYRRHFLSLLWKVVRIHVESGRLARYGIERDQVDDVMRLVRIDCECPTVASRDPKVAVDSDKVLVDGGVMSEQTWAARNGLDYEKEQKLGAKKAPPPVDPFGGTTEMPGQPGRPGASPFGQRSVSPVGDAAQSADAKPSPKTAAVAAALESVETTAEARAILRELYP